MVDYATCQVCTKFLLLFTMSSRFLGVFETLLLYPTGETPRRAFGKEQDMRKLGIFVIVLCLAMTAMPLAGADSGLRPFKGSVVGSITFPMFTECENYGGANVRTDSYATGTASHLGQVVLMSAHCTPEPGVDTIAGEMTLVAANGDEVYISYTGVNGPPDPVTWILISDVDFVITGGSGRFEGATGGGDMTAFVLFEGLDDPEWPVSWVWEGSIGY